MHCGALRRTRGHFDAWLIRVLESRPPQLAVEQQKVDHFLRVVPAFRSLADDYKQTCGAQVPPADCTGNLRSKQRTPL